MITLAPGVLGTGDGTGDGVVGLDDFALFVDCLHGPDVTTNGCGLYDYDGDQDVDLVDFAAFQMAFGSESRSVQVSYDYRNRMVEFLDPTTGGQRHTYAYDCFSRRIAKTVDADGAAEATRFFYGGRGHWQVVEEQDESNATLATYVYGNYIDDVLAMRRDVDTNGAPENYFYHHDDDQFNVMAVTDTAGSGIEYYEYGDYGQPELKGVAGTVIEQSAISNPYLFTGRRYDPETGLYYCRTRYLDPPQRAFHGARPGGDLARPLQSRQRVYLCGQQSVVGAGPVRAIQTGRPPG